MLTDCHWKATPFPCCPKVCHTVRLCLAAVQSMSAFPLAPRERQQCSVVTCATLGNRSDIWLIQNLLICLPGIIFTQQNVVCV